MKQQGVTFSLGRAEFGFADTADRTAPVFRQIFKGGTGRNTVFGIAFSRIVFKAANAANVFFHCLLLKYGRKKCHN